MRPAARTRGWAALLVAVAVAILGVGLARHLPPSLSPPGGGVSQELRGRLGRQGSAAADVARFYRARDYRPLWSAASRLRPEARQVVELVASAQGADGDSGAESRLRTAVAAASTGRAAALADAEIALSKALVEHVARLRQPADGLQLAFLDPALARAPTAGVLEAAARAPSLRDYLRSVDDLNPVYQALAGALVRYRAQWGGLPQVQVPAGPALRRGASGDRVRLLRTRLGLAIASASPPLFDAGLEQAVRRFQSAHGLDPTGAADAGTLAALNAGSSHYERLIAANLERARVLPPAPGRRFILVNVPAARLWLYQDGRLAGSMRVIVGKQSQQTPMMAGLVRYAVFNPYWNIPEDLVRDSIAPKVLKGGRAYFQAAHLQALSDWSKAPAELNPDRIDWPAVAAGRAVLRVRQRPGADNMMGAVKFMLPNPLGIYLHDTPLREAFEAPQRLLSSGCVRLEHASDLAAWLLGPARREAPQRGPDQRVDLPEPTPVYITYLTAAPEAGSVKFYPDVYGRDPALLRRLAERPRHVAQASGARPALGA